MVDGETRLDDAGRMVVAEWERLAERFPDVALDAFVVMPNHLHGIIIITHPDPVGAGLVPAPMETSVPAQEDDHKGRPYDTRWAFDRENPLALAPKPEDAWAL